MFFASAAAGFGQEKEKTDKAAKPDDASKPAPAEAAKKPAREDRDARPDGKRRDAGKEKRQPDSAEPGPGMVRRAWIGIATKDVAPVLREHLAIPEGFGVQIVHVVPGSPAAEAGLKPADVLTKLDDQLLTTPEHLALLVRMKKKGDKVPLAIVRKGQEQMITVTLDENDVPEFLPRGDERPFDFRFEPGPDGRGPWHFRGRMDLPEFDGKNWHEALRHYQDRFQEWMRENRPDRPRGDKRDADSCPMPGCGPRDAKSCPMPGCDLPAEKKQPRGEEKNRSDSHLPKPPPKLPAPDGEEKPAPSGTKSDTKSLGSASVSVSVNEGSGKPPAISVRSGFPLEVIGRGGMVRIDNPKGEVTITEKDGKHTIAVKNEDGETVYDGNYDPEKGISGLPSEAKELFKEMKLDDLQLVTPKIEKSDKKIEKYSKSKDPQPS